MLAALSDNVAVAIIGLIGLIAATALTTLGTVWIARIGKDTRSQNRRVDKAVADFEIEWEARGRIIDGQAHDIEVLEGRIVTLERREHDCLEALQEAHHRIAVLEERLGVTPGD